MKQKNTLSIRAPYSDKIVSVEGSIVSYVDNAFYKDHLFEDMTNPYYTNFPIKMFALKVDWIVSEEGKRFLQAVCNSENQELFNTKTVLVIVEFIYFKYRTAVLKNSLPFYLIQLVLFFVSILMFDDDGDSPQSSVVVVDYLNVISCFYTLYYILQNIY